MLAGKKFPDRKRLIVFHHYLLKPGPLGTKA
jgi:hypothetical protein